MRARSDRHSDRRPGVVAAMAASVVLWCAVAPASAADERAAVIETMQAWERAVEARDYDALADFYVADAVYYPRGAAPISGRDAIIARNRDRGSTGHVEITQHVDDVQIRGEWAIYSCLAEISVAETGATRYARVLLVMQRDEDGRWRILRDIDNDTPERPRGAAPKAGTT